MDTITGLLLIVVLLVLVLSGQPTPVTGVTLVVPPPEATGYTGKGCAVSALAAAAVLVVLILFGAALIGS